MAVIGIETEYGVLGAPDARVNAMTASALVVSAYAQGEGVAPGVRWSYESEDPLADARGWHLARESAHPSQLTDQSLTPEGALLQRARRDVAPNVTNVLLTNGARLYVDHAHPEYSSPEVTTARDAVLFDRAGEEVMLRAVRTLADSPHSPDIHLYKNNVDGKGASYGTHENYLVDRAVPFEDLVHHLTPFLVTRPIMVGAGRVGLGQNGQESGFQISQRADYIEAEVGLETTLRRPIINTRDEPHADPRRFRRLHVIIGDANCLEVSTYLKVGATALVLRVLEEAEHGGEVPLAWEGLALADPVAAVQEVSRDLTLQAPLETAAGRELTAWQIQRAYLDGVQETLADRLSPDEREVLATWRRVLDLLREDRDAAAAEVEWVAKLRVLEGLRARHHLAWDHPKLHAVDLQWSDVRPERGLYARLRASGAVRTLVTPQEVADALTTPPSDTRAWLRGQAVRRFRHEVTAAGWDGLVFDIPGRDTLLRLPMTDPYRGTQALLGEVVAGAADAGEFLRALGAPPAERSDRA